MRVVHKAVIYISLILLLATISQAKEWHDILPLHSTRQDVIRILGPAEGWPVSVYDRENELVLITYSVGTCNEGGIWNVPRDVVTRISVTPKKRLLINKLQLDLNDYQIVADKNFRGTVYYSDAQEGVHIQTQNDMVTAIDYLPMAKEDKLRCVRRPVGLVTKEGSLIDSHNLFDSYGYIQFDKEKVHLDLFGRQLKNRLDAKGFIAVHNGRHTSIKQAFARVTRALRYLTSQFRIKNDRIEIIKGAPREEFTLELYLVFTPLTK